MRNEDKIKIAKKKQENEKTKESIVLEAQAITKYTEQRRIELDEIKQSIEALAEALSVDVHFPDIQPLFDKLDLLKGLPDTFTEIKELSIKVTESLSNGQTVKIDGFRDLWEMIVRQNNKIDKANKEQQKEFYQKIFDIEEYIAQLNENLKQGQKAEDYRPVRLVVGGDGTPLDFLKHFPSSRGGGGSSSGGGSVTQGTTPWVVSADSLPLPSGAATSAKQDTQQTALDAIKTATEIIDNFISGSKGLVTEDNSAAIKTAVEIIDNAISGSEMQVDIVGALPAGTNNIGDVDVLSIAAGDNNIGNVDLASAIPAGINNIGDVDVLTLPALPAGTNNIGDIDVLTLPATPAGTNLIGAATPGASATVGTGTSHFRDPAVTNTAVAIKASAGKLHGYNLYNPNASLAYVHFYNVAAASVSVGTTTPLRSIALPSTANGTIGLDADFPLGIAFGTAISVAASTTATGGTAPGTALVVNAHYI